MGDFQSMRRDLSQAKRLERDRKRLGLVIEIASWVIVFAVLVALIKMKLMT